MAFRALCAGVLLSTLPVAGCGTVDNLVKPGPEGGGKCPFGGVRQDMCCIQSAANGESVARAHHDPESASHHQTALILLSAADLPFSLLGDLITWPYTAGYTYINQPVPFPPLTPAPVEPRPQSLPAPEVKEADKKPPEKDADQDKGKDVDQDKGKDTPPEQLPKSLLPPKKQAT